jgi:hypothetical protein
MWTKLKTWVQPLTPVVVLLWVVIFQPGWSPAGLISGAIQKSFDAKTTTTIDTAIYGAGFTYLFMVVFLLIDNLVEGWPDASISTEIEGGWDKQRQVRISPGTPVPIEVHLKATIKSDEAFTKLKRRMPDLAIEISWDNTWLEITANGLATARIMTRGDISTLSVPVLKGTGRDLHIKVGLLVDVLNEETRRRSFTMQLVTTHIRWQFWVVKITRKVKCSCRTLVVRLDKD